MEAYESSYTKPAHPLLVLSGFEDTDPKVSPEILQAGAKIKCDFPTLSETQGKDVLRVVSRLSCPVDSANGGKVADTDRSFKLVYRVCGREYTLPSRKANGSPAATSITAPDTLANLHSPLSPLSPGSPVYGSGIMSHLWPLKYLEIVPSVFVSFLFLGANAERDEEVKLVITDLKTALNESKYKSRLAVVIVFEVSDPEDPNSASVLETRANKIRKATKLDGKTEFFWFEDSKDPSYLNDCIASLLSALQPVAMDFYRETVKRVRRKRDRRNFPQQPREESSPPLPKAGWVVRDNFKLGLLSEFSSDMNAATNYYEATLDGLGQLDPIGTQRTGESRDLADVCAMRKIRCLLANGSPHLAVQSWRSHRDDVRATRYGRELAWQTWEPNWMRLMAQLTLEIPQVAVDANASKKIEGISIAKRQIFCGRTDDRLAAHDVLQHTGYWYLLSAFAIVSQSDSKNFSRLSFLDEAIEQFEKREQVMMSSWLKAKAVPNTGLLPATSMVYAKLAGLWSDQTWRKAAWPLIRRDLAGKLLPLSSSPEQYTIKLDSMLELQKSSATQRRLAEDVMAILEDAAPNTEADEQVLLSLQSLISAAASFGRSEVHAGEQLPVQIALTSKAFNDGNPICLSELTITFSGSVKVVNISHEEGNNTNTLESGTGSVTFKQVEISKELSDSADHFSASASLMLEPQKTLVLQFLLKIREPGRLGIESLRLALGKGKSRVQQTIDLTAEPRDGFWYVSDGHGTGKLQNFWKSDIVSILTRLPDLDLSLPDFREEYYTEEPVELEIWFTNNETSAIQGKVECKAYDHEEQSLLLKWIEEDASDSADVATNTVVHRDIAVQHSDTSSYKIAVVIPNQPSSLLLDIAATYTTIEDPETPLVQRILSEATVVRPLAVHCYIQPAYNPDPWPGYFNVNDVENEKGVEGGSSISSRWQVKTFLACHASQSIILEGVDVRIDQWNSGAHGSICKSPEISDSVLLAADEQYETSVLVDVEHRETEEDGNTEAHATALVKWRRPGNQQVVESVLDIPKLLFPASEPRALLHVGDKLIGKEEISMELVLENPTLHYLSFAITTEPGEDYAFSGPKVCAVHLLPLSKHIRYFVLVPFVQGAFIQPVIRVVDTYFNKALQVHPVGNARADAHGVSIWVDTED